MFSREKKMKAGKNNVLSSSRESHSAVVEISHEALILLAADFGK
jgi:hypothetical protein